MFSIKKDWTNWGQTATREDASFYMPRSIEEVQEVIVRASNQHKTIRTVGAGHSFSPVALPDSYALELSHMSGLIDLDEQLQQATFWAGTRLYEVGPLLAGAHLALENMGDIDVQTIAGAISTGTHGTGIQLGSISNQIVRWGIVDGNGQYREITRDQVESESMHISLGLMGVITDVTIQAVPLYGLAYESTKVTTDTLLSTFQQTVQTNRHAEWFYFPGQLAVQQKIMNKIAVEGVEAKPLSRMDLFLENNVLQYASSLCKAMPQMTKLVSKWSAKAVPTGQREDVSYRLFATPRKVKFVECEYAIPIEQFEACFEELHNTLSRHPYAVHFPIEIRTQKGERGFLSPTQGRDCVFIAFHMYLGMRYEPYFRYVHYVATKYGGRAHFGKMNRYDEGEFKKQYAHHNIFLSHLEDFDPQRLFQTDFFKQMLK